MKKILKTSIILSGIVSMAILTPNSAKAQQYYNSYPSQVQIQSNGYQNNQQGYSQYNQAYNPQPNNIFYGTIVNEQDLNPGINTDTVIGAGIGGVGGSFLGGSHNPSGHILGGLGGAILGGILGNSVSHASQPYQIAYTIQFRDNSVARVLQTRNLYLQVGQPVEVIGGPNIQIIPIH